MSDISRENEINKIADIICKIQNLGYDTYHLKSRPEPKTPTENLMTEFMIREFEAEGLPQYDKDVILAGAKLADDKYNAHMGAEIARMFASVK